MVRILYETTNIGNRHYQERREYKGKRTTKITHRISTYHMNDTPKQKEEEENNCISFFFIVSNVETNHKTTQTNKTDVTYERTAKRMPLTEKTNFHSGMIDESKHDDPY